LVRRAGGRSITAPGGLYYLVSGRGRPHDIESADAATGDAVIG